MKTCFHILSKKLNVMSTWLLLQILKSTMPFGLLSFQTVETSLLPHNFGVGPPRWDIGSRSPDPFPSLRGKCHCSQISIALWGLHWFSGSGRLPGLVNSQSYRYSLLPDCDLSVVYHVRNVTAKIKNIHANGPQLEYKTFKHCLVTYTNI